MLPCGVYNERYAQDMAVVRTKRHWGILILSIFFLYLFPLFNLQYFISLINYLCITIIIVLGLHIVTGFWGQVSFGQAGFMAIGAYTSAILTLKFGVSFWLALPLSGLSAAVIGLIGGAPSLRIKGFYLAMATLAIHFLTMWLIMHMEITGSTQGLHPTPPSIGEFQFDSDGKMYYIIVSVMLLMTYGAKNMMRTRLGRAFVAIRDNDLAAEVMGINLYRYKLLAFFISCFYAGIAGSLWAHWIQVVHPEQFTILHAVWYVRMLIVGGMGTLIGPIIGAVFLVILPEAARFLSHYREIVYGTILIVVILFRPQ